MAIERVTMEARSYMHYFDVAKVARVLEKPSQGIDTKKGKIVRSRTRAMLFQNELRKSREKMKK